MVGIAGGIVDANQFSDYVKVGDKLAIALHRHAEALEKLREVRHTNKLEELAEKIETSGMPGRIIHTVGNSGAASTIPKRAGNPVPHIEIATGTQD
jgi:hypothetical protein